MVPLNHSKSPVVGTLPDPAPPKSATPILSDNEQQNPVIPRVSSAENTARPNQLIPNRRNTYSPSQIPANGVAPQVGLPTSGQGKTQTVFIHKLYDMLEDQSLSHLIWWSPSNDSFCLYPGEEFSNVLAQYFKHTNIASFIRQLNMYGFHKVNDSFQSDEKQPPANSNPNAQSSTRWEFRHLANQFRKGDVHLLSLIKRKSLKVINSHKEIVSLKTLPPTSNAPVDDKYADQSQQQYHRAVYQLLWDQMSDAASTQLVSPKITTPASLYAPPAVVAYHGFPGYPHAVAALNVPHSPGSPPYPDHGVALPLYIHQPQLQPELRQPSLQTPGLPVDQLINLKLIEMNNSINQLKSLYLELLSRHENLTGLYQRSQTELLQLTEIVERLTATSSEPEIKKEPETIDRSKTKTPVDRITTPSNDLGMSPMLVKPVQKVSDLDLFKQQLVQRINQPIPTSSSGSKNTLHNYHLNDVSLTLSKGQSNYNIVPQHYPLNPNYSLYNNSSESVFRHFKMSSEDLQQQQRQAAAQPGRHVSILMDPLQPIPGRAPAMVPTSLGPESKDKNALESSTPQYVQQYQPLAMHQPPAHALYQYIRQETPLQQRTVSLPIIEKPLAANTMQQRHSTTTLPQQHQPHTLQHQMQQLHQPQPRLVDLEADHSHIVRGQSPLSRGPYPQAHTPTQPIPPAQPQAQPLAHQMPPIQAPAHVQNQVQLKHEHTPPPIVNLPPRDTRLPLRNQLPSVSELDKSIKSSGRVYDLLLESGEDRSKKRKVET